MILKEIFSMLTVVLTIFLFLVAIALADSPIKCPPVNDVDVTILPNPHDCKTFYICNEGIPFLMTCPSDQEFNAELRVCDFPEQANCLPSGYRP